MHYCKMYIWQRRSKSFPRTFNFTRHYKHIPIWNLLCPHPKLLPARFQCLAFKNNNWNSEKQKIKGLFFCYCDYEALSEDTALIFNWSLYYRTETGGLCSCYCTIFYTLMEFTTKCVVKKASLTLLCNF